MTSLYSLKDVAAHSSNESPWFIIRGKVYNISNLLPKHPGGEKVLMEYAGKDATSGFEGRNHSDKAKLWMKEFQIGVLGDQPKKWYQCGLYQVLGGAVLVAGLAITVGIVIHRITKK